MAVPFNESSIPGHHTIRYRVRDDHKGNPEREVEVLATPEEIQAFVRDGYLVRERLIPMQHVERLRQAFDEVVARDDRLETKGGKRFGGVFMRHMMDKHPAFLEFLDFPPAVSVARALFGPFVQSRGFTGRVCYPDAPEQETVWHFHQRLVPDPLPPMFSRPQSLDVLIYLDDIDDLNGPLCVLPGSHQWMEEDLSVNDFEEKPGQVILRLPAGSCVMAHGALWLFPVGGAAEDGAVGPRTGVRNVLDGVLTELDVLAAGVAAQVVPVQQADDPVFAAADQQAWRGRPGLIRDHHRAPGAQVEIPGIEHRLVIRGVKVRRIRGEGQASSGCR